MDVRWLVRRGWLARLQGNGLADKRAFEALDAELMGLAKEGYGVDVLEQEAQVGMHDKFGGAGKHRLTRSGCSLAIAEGWSFFVRCRSTTTILASYNTFCWKQGAFLRSGLAQEAHRRLLRRWITFSQRYFLTSNTSLSVVQHCFCSIAAADVRKLHEQHKRSPSWSWQHRC